MAHRLAIRWRARRRPCRPDTTMRRHRIGGPFRRPPSPRMARRRHALFGAARGTLVGTATIGRPACSSPGARDDLASTVAALRGCDRRRSSTRIPRAHRCAARGAQPCAARTAVRFGNAATAFVSRPAVERRMRMRSARVRPRTAEPGRRDWRRPPPRRFQSPCSARMALKISCAPRTA